MTARYKMGHPRKMWLWEICIFPTNLLSASYNFAGITYRRTGEPDAALRRHSSTPQVGWRERLLGEGQGCVQRDGGNQREGLEGVGGCR
jgi:hypothetical protein